MGESDSDKGMSRKDESAQVSKTDGSIEGLAIIFKAILLLQTKVTAWATSGRLKRQNSSEAELSRRQLLELTRLISSHPAFRFNADNLRLNKQSETGAEIQRFVIGKYVEGLLKSAKHNNPVDASVKGFAWHFLTTDARSFLQENGQTINNKWLMGKMGPLMITNVDPKAIKHELSLFIKGDPTTISRQSPSHH